MPIANYTTTIPPENTAAQISRMLANFGAKKIITDYDDNGNLSGLQFLIPFNGR